MRVVLSDPLLPDVVDEYRDRLDIVVAPDGEALRRELAHAVGLVVTLSVKVDDELLACGPGLRVVGNFAVGVDNIDLEACRRRGIAVVNTPDVLTRSTAECALLLLLACARRLPEGERMCRADAFGGWEPRMLLGRELLGLKAVLVGRGRIGQATARLFEAVGLDVDFITRADDDGAVQKKLGAADVVSLHVPLTSSTRHWLNAERLSWLKPDAIVINTARGPVVDEQALIEVLERGALGGAGLDVFEEEPRIPARLRALDRVVLLPHLGSATRTARAGMARKAVGGVAAVLAGEPPDNRVV